MKLKSTAAVLILIIGTAVLLTAAETLRFSGLVQDDTGQPLPGANIVLTNTGLGAAADDLGRFVLTLSPGDHPVKITYIGYRSLEDTLHISKTGLQAETFILKQEAFDIGGITVIADRELMPDKAASSTSIRSGEIEHSQAGSLADILQLLPESEFVNPSLTDTRQAGIRASEVESTADRNQYLGTQIMVDGIPLSNNANMQIDTEANSGTVQRTTENSGMDLRQIPADNIESVEVIKGIPSSRYGDLTSGLVHVTTRMSTEPLRLKYKSNLMDKELNLSSGLSRGNHDLSANVNVAHSLRDRRIPGYDFTRVALQLSQKSRISGKSLTMGNRFYLTRTFDEQDLREDDLLLTQRYNRDYILRWTGTLDWLPGPHQSLKLNVSHSDNHQNSYSSRLVSVDNTYVTDLLEEGAAEGSYVQNYITELRVNGIARQQLLTLDHTVGIGSANTGHRLHSGILLRRELNTGEGRIFDPMTPPSISSILRSRPRAYDGIPALMNSALYAEDIIKGRFLIPYELNIGARLEQYGENSLFSSDWGSAVHPRLNILLKPFKDTQIRAGYGSTSKSPTLAMLYPNPAYYDVDDVNRYDDVDSLRQVIVSTYIYSRENSELEASIQTKKEFSIDQRIGNAGMTLTFYENNTRGGFAQSLVEPVFLYQYDYPEWPDTTGRTVRDSVFTTFSRWTNSADMDSKGLEFSLQTKEIESIHARFRIEAAWNSTETRSDGLDYSDYYRLDTLTSQYIKPIWNNENNLRERLQVNYRAEFIWKELGAWLTLEVRHTVFDRDRYLGTEDSLAIGYMEDNGELHWFADPEDVPENSIFLRVHPDYYSYEENRTNVFLLNARLSKSLFPGAEFSFYVNNLLNSRPLYQRQRVAEGIISYTRLNPELYFGIEFSMQIGGKK